MMFNEKLRGIQSHAAFDKGIKHTLTQILYPHDP